MGSIRNYKYSYLNYNYGYKYLKWGLYVIISIVTLIITPITTSHDPPSRARALQGSGGFALLELPCSCARTGILRWHTLERLNLVAEFISPKKCTLLAL